MMPSTASRYLGLGLEWVSAKDAIALIQEVLDRGPKTAYAKLIECCASHEVASSSLNEIPRRPFEAPQLQIANIPPGVWLCCNDSAAVEKKLSIDLDSSRFRGPASHDGLIQINADDLRKRLTRRRPGPVPGKIRRYEDADRALFPELRRIMREGKLSLTQAARELEDRIEAPNTSPEGKVKRLVKLYNSSLRIRT